MTVSINVTVERQLRLDNDCAASWALAGDDLLLIVKADLVTEEGARVIAEAVESVLKHQPVRHLRDMTGAPTGRAATPVPLRLVDPKVVA